LVLKILNFLNAYPKSNRKQYQLTFEDGTIANADAVIGADGIKSVVRHQILNIGKLRSSKQKCWRGVIESDWTENTITMLMKPGKRQTLFREN
jgi:2-polyprenyl-6-methoxyphenol hydroxylase-like FAD-dependent oxidoreductase